MHSDSAENRRPVPPVRTEYAQSPQQEPFLPKVPERMDLHEHHTDAAPHHNECACNYNRYATKKTVGHGFLEVALIMSNAMQLRTLIIQKQRDGIWIASLVLVCLSLVAQIGLMFILVVVGKGNIQDATKQPKLERYNNFALFITMLIAIINVIINVFMSTTNPASYIDASLLASANNNS